MPTIADYLKNLLKQRKDLADNLVQKGLDASDTELLDTLVPKVLDIQTKEDLDNELNLYNTELTEQETLIDNIIEALINKRFEGINLQELQVEAKKDEQIITPSGDVDGFNKVTVSPVTSNIDENIIPENIKEGVTILDVVGTLQGGSEEKPYHIKYGNYFFTNSNIRLNEFPDIASIFTEDLISTSYMFNNCSSLKEAPLFNTSGVTNMSYMFYGCSKLTTVPLYDTSKVTDMSSMFSGCSILTTIPLLNTTNVTTMNGMFSSCYNLNNIPLLNTTNVTTMSSMFSDCRNLTTLSLYDTSNVTNMSYMFDECSNLNEISLYNTTSLKNTSYMFNNCSSLKEAPLFNTSQVTTMSHMFYGCSKLTTVPLYDTSKVTDMSSMFSGCSILTTLSGFADLGKAYDTTRSENYFNYKLDLSKNTQLTHDSLMNVIENLYDILTAGCRRQMLQLGTDNLAKLSEDEKQIATNKGWNLS